MKKSLLKVKNTITFEDKLNAIDLILNAFWDDETGEYIFDTDLNKLYLYLLQFGKHAKVIEPIELKNKLNNFHMQAIDND